MMLDCWCKSGYKMASPCSSYISSILPVQMLMDFTIQAHLFSCNAYSSFLISVHKSTLLNHDLFDIFCSFFDSPLILLFS